jgi:hypothetical protein
MDTQKLQTSLVEVMAHIKSASKDGDTKLKKRNPPSLKEAEDSRLMSRIERNFEILRRDGKASGTLSGWGQLLIEKFASQKAESSDLTPAQVFLSNFLRR